MLERSRVTAVPPGERSFHVYYQLLHAPSEETRRELRLQGGGTPQDYKYLRRGARLVAAEAEGIGQARLRLTEAFDALGLSAIEAAAMRLVSAALCLGNVAFQAAAGPGGQGEGSVVAEPPPLDAVAALLGLEAAPLEAALCTRVMVTRGERIELGLSAAQAAQQRDSLASYLHCQLFEQLVHYANQTLAAAALDCAEAAGAAGAGGAAAARRVGVVDMFGFEQFETNSFEQLCINFANEKLQAQYLGLVLRLEQAEYEREGITWSPLASLHTDGPLRLIEDPAGLIALLDEQCRLGERGSDDGSNPNPNPNPSPSARPTPTPNQARTMASAPRYSNSTPPRRTCAHRACRAPRASSYCGTMLGRSPTGLRALCARIARLCPTASRPSSASPRSLSRGSSAHRRRPPLLPSHLAQLPLPMQMAMPKRPRGTPCAWNAWRASQARLER